MAQAMTVEQLFRQVQGVWDAARGRRAMPSRADIDAVKLGPALPHVSLLEVVLGDPLDFRYRVLGQELIKGYGLNLTGQLHTVVADRTLPSWPYYVAYITCVTTGQPQSIDAETRNRKKLLVNVKGRVWPLSDDGKTVAGLLGAAMYSVPAALAS